MSIVGKAETLCLHSKSVKSLTSRNQELTKRKTDALSEPLHPVEAASPTQSNGKAYYGHYHYVDRCRHW